MHFNPVKRSNVSLARLLPSGLKLKRGLPPTANQLTAWPQSPRVMSFDTLFNPYKEAGLEQFSFSYKL